MGNATAFGLGHPRIEVGVELVDARRAELDRLRRVPRQLRQALARRRSRVFPVLVVMYVRLARSEEQEAERAFGDRAILVRPGLIAGPNDPTDRFTYWPRRAERGGPILAPPDQPVQMIDVRDLAAWTIRLVEDGGSGPYNATSPPHAITFDSLLEACAATDVVS